MRDVVVKVEGSSYVIKGVFEEIERRKKYTMKHRTETRKKQNGKDYYALGYFENNAGKRNREKMKKQSQYRKGKQRKGARNS